MTPVFVDTSALIALGNARDTFYRQAQDIRRELISTRRHLVTTDLVLVEFCSAFSPVMFRSTAVTMVESITQSEQWSIVSLDSELFEQGFDRFKQMTDKDWSLVDCLSMLVANQYGIVDVFSNDHHFEQAGFRCLLKRNE
jgi:predicted nucleic acid-binding protein